MTEPRDPFSTAADEARVAQQGRRWRAHSRRVRFYRRVLPIIMLVLAGGALTWTVFRTVTIGPNVRISDGGSGFVLTTPEAVVDTRTGIITGSKGVQGAGPLGTINASSYAIYDQGQRVVFNGQGDTKIRGTINPSGSGG